MLVNGHTVAGPPPAPDDPTLTSLAVTDIDVLLGLEIPADIDLGGNGTINLHSKGKKGNLELTARGTIAPPDGLALTLNNLDASVSKLKVKGTTIDAASVSIDEVKDTRLHFSQPTPGDVTPGILEGTIINGAADNVTFDFGAPAAPTPAPKKGTP